MIERAENTPWEWICASEFDSRSLVARYPEAAKYFSGDNLDFTDFSARPWELHEQTRLAEIASRNGEVVAKALHGVRNLCLLKRSVFEKIGYADVSFWPGGYFEDSDYCTRARLAGIKACTLADAAYFHFWSRTIHQGGRRGSFHDRTFQSCERFYRTKWGGSVGAEKWRTPFDGNAHRLDNSVLLPGALSLSVRSRESAIIQQWESASRA